MQRKLLTLAKSSENTSTLPGKQEEINVLEPIEEVLNPKMIARKKLSDLNMEIFMNQLEGEDEPFEMMFEDEIGNEDD